MRWTECENSMRKGRREGDRLIKREKNKKRGREGEKECELKKGENKAGLITEALTGQCIQNTPAELPYFLFPFLALYSTTIWFMSKSDQ